MHRSLLGASAPYQPGPAARPLPLAPHLVKCAGCCSFPSAIATMARRTPAASDTAAAWLPPSCSALMNTLMASISKSKGSSSSSAALLRMATYSSALATSTAALGSAQVRSGQAWRSAAGTGAAAAAAATVAGAGAATAAAEDAADGAADDTDAADETAPATE